MNKVGRPLKYKTPKELKKAITKYFNKQDIDKEPYTIIGLALALGFRSRDALLSYNKKEEFHEIVNNARMKIRNRIEQELIKRKSSVIGLLFWLKNNAGWKDRQEFTGSDGTPISINLINYAKGVKAKPIKTKQQDIKKSEAKR